MKDSKIPWTDHTFNPWQGCSPASEGCANCYARSMHERWKGPGSFATRAATSIKYWEAPYAWDRLSAAGLFLQCPACGARGSDFGTVCPTDGCSTFSSEMPSARPRVFCGSMCDWLDPAVPSSYRGMLFALIRRTPHLDWLLLTKRPQLWASSVAAVGAHESFITLYDNSGRSFCDSWLAGNPPPNVWFGVTAENQARWDERVDILSRIPARVRFVSCEPLLDQVLLRRQDYAMVDWLIAGGENGPRSRPCASSWLLQLRSQCVASDIPFFFKGWGDRTDLRSAVPTSLLTAATRQYPEVTP